jgi:serine O-acetyltransferase
MPSMFSLIREDLKASVDQTRVFGAAFWVKVLGKLLITPQVQVVVLFRLGHALAGTPLRPLAFVLRSWGLMISGAEIHPDAQIGPGMSLMHSSGVVIGGGVVAGKGLRMAQGATLGEPAGGGADANRGFPTLGDYVSLGAHAVVLGSRSLADGCVVGANSVVTRDVPELTVVVGAPAREVKTVTWVDVINRPSKD